MGFTSPAFIEHQSAGRNVGAEYIFSSFSPWRLIVFSRFYFQLLKSELRFCKYYYYGVWFIFRSLVICLAHFGYANRNFGTRSHTLEWILSYGLKAADSGLITWQMLWVSYFVTTDDLIIFLENYSEAWHLQLLHRTGLAKELIIFIDNEHRFVLPCSSSMDDRDLIRLLRLFYDVARASRGLFEFLGARSSERIDVVELEQSFAVGPRVGVPLNLGMHGSHNSQIYFFRDASRLTGNSLMRRLEQEGALTDLGHEIRALNIVRRLDSQVAGIIITIPIIASFIIAVVWAIVSSVHFKADAQVSTQTGFTIGSYVVTAGSLLIALVAFLDTRHAASG